MRIAFFQRELPVSTYGGVATQVHDLANALVKMGDKVTVFTLSTRPEDGLYDVETIVLPSFVSSSKLLKRYLLGYYFCKIDTGKFDIVHTHGDNFLMYIDRPQIRTFYGSALMEFRAARTIQRKLTQIFSYLLEIAGVFAADKRVVISPGTAKCIPFVTEVIPCGVDRNVFYGSEEKNNNPVLLFVGSMNDRKRGDYLLDIMPDLVRKFPDIVLKIAGRDSVNNKNVESLGSVDRKTLADVYRKAWILVSPSEYEGFGLPALEALASGTAVVARDNHGSRYLLDNGKYGMLCSKENMLDNLLMLLSSREKREEFGKMGLERAKEFDIMNTARKYRELYAELLAR